MLNEGTATKTEGFSERFMSALENHPRCPVREHGRLKWFRDLLEQETGVDVSLQSVQKWSAGSSIPRASRMGDIAQALGVDEVWLSMGRRKPAISKSRAQRVRAAAGAVLTMAGVAEMSGAHVAFPEDDESSNTVFLTMNGMLRQVTVVAGNGDKKLHFAVPTNAAGNKVIGVTVAGLQVRLFDLTNENRSAEGEIVREDRKLEELHGVEEVFA